MSAAGLFKHAPCTAARIDVCLVRRGGALRVAETMEMNFSAIARRRAIS